MPEQFGDKTQEATPYRRQQAREKGQVPKSQDLTSAGILLLGLGTLRYFGGSVGEFLLNNSRNAFTFRGSLESSPEQALTIWNATAGDMARVMLPVLGVMVVGAIILNLMQVGFLFLPKNLGFDLSRINPLSGIKRMFSLTNFTKLGFGLVKMLIVSLVAAVGFYVNWGDIVRVGADDVGPVFFFIFRLVVDIGLQIGAALFILALLDYGFQRWKHEQDLMMSIQEVKEEVKTLQGDPNVQARRRVIQRQLVLQRIKNDTPSADVVVTNPTELAIAIKYDVTSMNAPMVVAKGAGVLAQRIRLIALENEIPIVERKELARALYKQVDVQQEIPADHYAAVAEVLRYVYELKGTPEALRRA